MRIFIAALLDDDTRRHISDYISSIKGRISGVKWERQEKLHITLKFLGEIEQSKLPDICNVVDFACGNMAKIEMAVSHFGAFPNLSRPRVLYTGFDDSEQINGLQQSIDSRLTDYGFAPESRKFIPHVTIGRVNSRYRLQPPVPLVRRKECRIDSIAVVQSVLDSHGSRYKNLEVYKLY